MLLWLWLLWGRCQTWTTLTLVGHDATEETALAVAERWRGL